MSYIPLDGISTQLDIDVLSPFGDLLVAEIHPSIQMDFEYGINSQTGVSSTSNGGTVDTSDGRLRLQSGTHSAGGAIFQSMRPSRYRPGQGTIARFTPIFVTSAANSKQYIGAGSATEGYFVGYNGTQFGILYLNGGVETWIPQSLWNGDKCDGTGATGFNWNTGHGNVVQIKYPYLGYGNVTFWVQNSETGRWILFHTIKYTNSSAVIQLSRPALYFYGRVINSGNTANLTVYCGSVGFFTCGPREFVTSPKWGYDNNKTGITTETNLFSLKNATTFNGQTNRGLVRLQSVSFGTANNSVITLILRLQATLGGVPSYTPRDGTTADNGATITNGNSVVSADILGTTVSGGTYLWSMTLGSNGSGPFDLTPFNLFVPPGYVLTVGAKASTSSTCGASLTWTEDI